MHKVEAESLILYVSEAKSYELPNGEELTLEREGSKVRITCPDSYLLIVRDAENLNFINSDEDIKSTFVCEEPEDNTPQDYRVTLLPLGELKEALLT